MSKKFQVIVSSLSIFGLAVFFGCASFQDVLTPAHLSPVVMDYIDVNDVPLPPFEPLLPWWNSLFDLRVISGRVEFIHQYRQMDETLKYTFIKGVNNFYISTSEQFQLAVFSPEGPIGLLFPALLGTSLGALLIKRPGDKSKKELEKEANSKKK